MNLPTIVIGGGISGITAAVEMAEAGQQVVLVEKEPYLGGKVTGFNNYFPKLCPPACGLEINFRRIRSNPRISYYTGAEITWISGGEGDFKVLVSIAPRLINNQCTSCGKCAEVCPAEQPSKPGQARVPRAAYIPGGLAFPMKYTIDESICLKQTCGKCLDVCDFDAIQLEAKTAEIELQARRIILATGWQPYDASRLETYRYSEEANVVTNLEFEGILADCARENRKLSRPSDGTLPGRIAFVQCAGSRDLNHLPYCSAVCCSATVKHALTLAEHYPGIKTEVFYIDLRLSGRNEKLLRKAESHEAITMTKGKVGRISKDDETGELFLEVEDVMAGSRRVEPFDMVVLATGLVPEERLPSLSTNEFGFYTSQQDAGIYPAGSSKRPMDVSSSVRDAAAVSLKAMHI